MDPVKTKKLRIYTQQRIKMAQTFFGFNLDQRIVG